MIPYRHVLILLVFITISIPALADVPVVSNVVASQRLDGSGLVDVVYDVFDAENDTLYITLQASVDGGTTWNFPCRTVSGDVGPNVQPGASRVAVWDFGVDNHGLELSACSIRIIASDLGVDWHAQSPAQPAIHAWQTIDWDDEKKMEEMARANMLILTSSFILGNTELDDPGLFDRIRQHNPDIKIIAYILAKNIHLSWESTNNEFTHALYDSLRPYWSFTTTGDTLQDWDRQVVLNILNPNCRDALVGEHVRWLKNSIHQFDGVFWDYFNNTIWVPAWLDVEGDPDMNGNMIPMANDPEEIDAYRSACTDMVTAMQDSMGPGFIQIFNGQRAYADSTFASLGDGMNYELFPVVFFSQDQGMSKALDPDYEYNVFRTVHWPRSTNGGPYVLLENIQKNYYISSVDGLAHELVMGKIMRAVALLTGATPVFGGHHYGWPYSHISIGEPLGPAVETINGFTRQFQYGDIEIVWRTGSMPLPFDYTIRAQGAIIEQMQIPYEYPVTPEFPDR